jgi:hypothetical protein
LLKLLAGALLKNTFDFPAERFFVRFLALE